MKVYIAGPMRGIPEFNFPAFFAAEDYLKEQGHVCFNPARRDNDRHGADLSKGNATGDEAVAAAQHGFSLREALRDDTQWISMEAEAIALLPGWQNSKGARAEKALAEALNLEIIYLPGATPASEYDPTGKSAGEPGAKLDAVKSPILRGVLQYFPRSVIAVGNLSKNGAAKYTWKGWESVEDGINRYGDALARHMVAEAIEGPWDKTAMNDPTHPYNVLHSTAQAWNAMARNELMLREMEK
jgi:hypothetical protein